MDVTGTIPINLMGVIHALLDAGDSKQNTSLQKPGSDIPLLVSDRFSFNFNSPQAVSPDYIDEVRAIVEKLPNERWGVDGIDGDLDKGVDAYLDLEYEGFKGPSNPLDLIMLEELRLYNWAREREAGLEIKLERSHSRSPIEDNFIRVMKSWNEYYLGILEALNIPNPQVRKEQIDQIGINIFDKEKKLPVFNQQPLSEISPSDDAVQWFTYNALNVLLSPEPRITPLARFRAIETLSSFNIKELAEKFLGEGRNSGVRGYKGNTIRSMPYFGFTHWFEKNMLRLPRSFWASNEEKTQPIHSQWRTNKTIEGIFGFVTPRYNQTEPIDYNRAFNTLVTKHPNEAVQIALMVFANEDQAAGFAGLCALGRLDLVAANDVFGSSATYLHLGNMPQNISEHILHGLGAGSFDHDVAADYSNLPKADVLKALRRTLQQNTYLEEQISDMNSRWADTYFATTKKKNLNGVDPKGYWRLLGVHPETNPDDLDIVLKAAYRKLSMKYHPDKTDNPNLQKMKDINNAYEVLSDPLKRKQYVS